MSEKIESSSKLNTPPLEYLRQCFRYEPDTGKVFWIERPLSHFGLPRGKKRADNQIGKEAGNPFFHSHHPSPCGLKTSILYLGKPINILMHHVAWRLTHGDIPAGFVMDHIDRNPMNNVLTNLRLATPSQNCANQKDRVSKRGLPRGVNEPFKGKGFVARIGVGRKRIHIGIFKTAEEAHQAYLDKALELNGEFFIHQKEGESGG